MPENIVKHIRFNLEKDTHREALDLLMSLDRTRFPTYADAISDGLIELLSKKPAPGIDAAEIHAFVEPYVAHFSEEVLKMLSGKLKDSAEEAKPTSTEADAPEAIDVPAAPGDEQYADAIPFDEIPWDFINQ